MSQAARVCPACGTRNKPTWEFCVRCGESIADVAPQGPAEATSKQRGSRKPAVLITTQRQEGVGWGWWLGVALLAPLTVFACQWYGRGGATPEPPPPNTFIGATPEPLTKAPSTSPAVAAYAEATRFAAQGDLNAAAGAFAEAVELDPENAAYRKAYGDCLAQLSRLEDALAQYAAAAQVEPGAVLYARTWAEALKAMGRTSDAADVYESAVSANPTDVTLLRSLAAVRGDLGDHSAAATLLERAVGVRPDDILIRQELGVALHKAGEHDRAAEVLSAALDAHPNARITRSWLAEAQFNAGDTDRAIETLRAGIAMESEIPVFHRTLATILERARRPADAAREYREYVRLAPNASDVAEFAKRASQLEAMAR